MDEALKILVEKDAIRAQTFKYATAVDTRDWATVRTCFEDQVALNYGTASADLCEPGGTVDAQVWVRDRYGFVDLTLLQSAAATAQETME